MSADVTDGRRTLTVRQIIEGLTPGQLWRLITGLVALLIASFGVGQRFPLTPTGATAVPCHQAATWPAGQWLTWGHISHSGVPPDHEFPQITTRVTIESAVTGTAITDEKGRNGGNPHYRFTISPALRPGTTVRMTGQDGTGYTSTSNVFVTEDGCMMKGDFVDSHDTAGTVQYFFERAEYFVRP